MRSVEERRFTTHDGVELFYRHWPATGSCKGAILLFHRGHEHSGRVAHLVDELDLPEFSFFAWDARGHGHSPGERGFSPSVGTSIRDVETFVAHIGSEHHIATRDIAIIAQSVGAVIAAGWVHDYAPSIRCQVLASPAFSVKLYVPFARSALALMYRVYGHFFVDSYVKATVLTHDLSRVDSYARDPLITKPISVNILLGLYEAAKRIVSDAHAIRIPTQLLISGDDWVVHHAPQHAFFENLGCAHKERHILPGFYHDTLGERDRTEVIASVRSFLCARFETTDADPALPDLIHADRCGYTRDEADRLASPLPASSLRGLYWSATRAVLSLGGMLSDGIALGYETGFDSGSTLDYVYRDQPSGRGPLGRLIDRLYLDAIGWRGIRQRKQHIEALVCLAMARLREEERPIHLVDIAAGYGRYALDAIASSEIKPDSILLRDYSEINITAGRRLLYERGLSAIGRFERGDAFDEESLAALSPSPTLGIISGLFELFPDNSRILRSLRGLAAAMAPGSLLVYTNQPWHPQLELIARALTSHRDGVAWLMRRRTQAEMDALVAHAGFRKIAQRIDEWGIFTVSLAVRIESQEQM